MTLFTLPRHCEVLHIWITCFVLVSTAYFNIKCVSAENGLVQTANQISYSV